MAGANGNGRPVHPLKARRLEQGLIQGEVADRAGCAVSLVSMCEHGYQPSEHMQQAIANAVGASVGSFWT